jgi:hypothetical protein
MERIIATAVETADADQLGRFAERRLARSETVEML